MWKSPTKDDNKESLKKSSSILSSTTTTSSIKSNDFWTKMLGTTSTCRENDNHNSNDIDDDRNIQEDGNIYAHQSTIDKNQSSIDTTDDINSSITDVINIDHNNDIEIEVIDEKDKKTSKNKSSFHIITKMIGMSTTKSTKNNTNNNNKNTEDIVLEDDINNNNNINKIKVIKNQNCMLENDNNIEENQNKLNKQSNNNNNNTIINNNNKSTTSNSLGTKLLQLISGNKNDSKNDKLDINDIIEQFRESINDNNNDHNNNDNDNMNDPNSIIEIYNLFNQYKILMKNVANKYIGNINIKQITPTSIYYYIEKQDEIKNPSYKRRQHRFYNCINMNNIYKLNNACNLAMLSYLDTIDEIKNGLLKISNNNNKNNNNNISYELLHAELRSEPGKPANFVAVQKNNNDNLNDKMKKKDISIIDIIIVIRGTKTAADAFTDLLCDSESYNGGKAHSFIVTSGIYICDKHHKLLLDLLKNNINIKQINITYIGHSLGAGVASIAGMEYNNKKSLFYNNKIKVNVIGFGCPALVSENLAINSYDYITTIINDADLVPRLSGISFANMLYNILEFDWSEYAKKDLYCTLNELERQQPLIFKSTGASNAIKLIIENLLNKYSKDMNITIENYKNIERLPVELYPPGKCIHLYNDGRGISANYVPNTFFNEIDVTRRMIDDHLFFSGYQGTFLAVLRQHKRDHHFTFDDLDVKTDD